MFVYTYFAAGDGDFNNIGGDSINWFWADHQVGPIFLLVAISVLFVC